MSTNTALWARKEQTIDAKFFKWGSIERIFINPEKKIETYEIIEFDSQYGVGKYIKVSISLDGIMWETKLLKVDSVRLTSALKVVSDSIEKFPYLTAQLFSSIDIRFREMSDIIIIAEGQDKNQDFVYSAINKATNSISKFKINHAALPELYKFYNTLELIKPIDLENSMIGMSQLEKADLADKIIKELKEHFPNKKNYS